MLHILWLIIKCIGIILSLLLAVLLFAVLVILFCPVRYRARASKSAESWEAFGKITWLSGLFSMTISGGSAGFHTQIRLCRVKADTWKKLFIRKKKRPPKNVRRQDSGGSDSALQQSKKQDPENVSAKQEENREKPVSDKTISAKNTTEENSSEKNISEDNILRKFINNLLKKENFLKRLWRNITDKCRNIRNALKKIITAVQKLCRTISLWKDFLEQSQTKAAFHTTWQQALGLLRHAGPRKWKGYVNLGLGDPASTGHLLAALGTAYPVFRGRLSVTPEWDRKILEGNVHVKGRIYGVVRIYAAARLYFNKDVKRTCRWLMQQVG